MWVLPILSGVLIGTSYIPFPPWASLFCFVPLWTFWYRQTNLKQVILGGCITSFVFTLIGFNWVTYLLHDFAHLPWILAAVGMLFFAMLAHLFVPVAGALWFFAQKKFAMSERLSISLMAMITVLCEAYSVTLFDWNFGYSWYGSGVPVYQLAEYIGFSGLSAATVLASLSSYFIWKHRRQPKGKILALAVVLIFVVLNVVGVGIETQLLQPDATFKVLMVQGNIGNEEKSAAELGLGFRDKILLDQLLLTQRGLNSSSAIDVDFALWPEAAFPSLLGEASYADGLPVALKQFLASRRLALITGGYGVDQPSNRITNSLFLLDRSGNVVDPHYSKTHLLAFGEYIPGEDWFPQIRQWLPPIGEYARGPGPTVLLAWNGFKIGPQICYESLFPEFSRGLANLGAQFIVNVTNDSWYGTWQEPYQHMIMTLARAVEFRRPVLRATNTGISTVALASGKILEQSPMHQEWFGIYTVPYNKVPLPTFYQQWHFLVPSVLWVSLLVLLILASGAKRNDA